MLIDELKKESMLALKAKDQNKRGILSIVINKYMLLAVEARESGKEVGDKEVLQIIQKTIKELTDEANSFIEAGNPEKAELVRKQMDVISSYLPKQLTEDEIRAEISKLEDKSMPAVMKHFKANFAGKVDMGLVSKIVRSL